MTITVHSASGRTTARRGGLGHQKLLHGCKSLPATWVRRFAALGATTVVELVRVEGLEKKYLSFRHEIHALNGLDLTVERGDVFGFLGPNGAGKTTTIRILATILSPTAGVAEVDGHDTRREALAVRALVGYVPENPGAYPLLSGLENLVYWGRLQGIDRATTRNRARSLMAELGLEEAANQKLKSYSHGMRKRLSVAQALIHDPLVLLLDEPTGGLDPQGIRFFRDLIGRLTQQGKTVFLSSHLLTEVEQTCRTIGVIDRGRMLAVGSMDTILKKAGETLAMGVLIQCDPPSDKVLRILADLVGVRNVTRTPHGLHVETAREPDIVDQIVRILVSGEVRIRAVTPSETSLEAAYLSILGVESDER